MSNLALQTQQPQAISAFASEASFVSVQRMAKALCSSTLVPESYRGDANLGNCIIALELSQRIGASVMAVMQSMVPIHGKPTWSAAFLIATVNSCGRFTPMRFRWQGKEGTDEWGCRAYATEKETNQELVGALVTIAMAKSEGWYGKNGSKWKTMPEQMLQYRAATFWTRAYAPELSLGMKTSDEVVDIEAEAVPAKPAVVDVTPSPSPTRRKKAEPAPTPAPEPEPAQAPEPEPAAVVVEPVVESAPEPAPTPTVVAETNNQFVAGPETVEGTLAAIGITYQRLQEIAGELGWWEKPEQFATTADLPEEISTWIIRNRRGIARQIAKGGK